MAKVLQRSLSATASAKVYLTTKQNNLGAIQLPQTVVERCGTDVRQRFHNDVPHTMLGGHSVTIDGCVTGRAKHVRERRPIHLKHALHVIQTSECKAVNASSTDAHCAKY